MKLLRLSGLTSVLILSALEPSLAQEQHATVYGTISAKNDTAVAGVQVIIQLDRCDCSACAPVDECGCCPGLTLTVSNQKGHYSLTVPPGIYSIRINHPGYPRVFLANNRLDRGMRWKKDFKL